MIGALSESAALTPERAGFEAQDLIKHVDQLSLFDELSEAYENLDGPRRAMRASGTGHLRTLGTVDYTRDFARHGATMTFTAKLPGGSQ
jgi:hypothetical protein